MDPGGSPQAPRASARRAILMVLTPRQGVAMSSVSIIRRVDPLPDGDQAAEDPFRFQNSRIIPNLGEPIRPTPGASLSLYFEVYLPAEVVEAPQVELELLQDGEVVARAPVRLPTPDGQRRISYVGTIPAENMNPGQYEICAVVRHGKASAEEHAFFTVNP